MNPSSSSSPFYFCEPEFSELLWENGQIVTHDHSSRPASATKFSQYRHELDHEAGHTSSSTTCADGYGFSIGKANIDILSAGADANAHANDENTVPWMNFSHHDPLPMSSPLPSDDFCSDFIEGFVGSNSTSMGFGFGFGSPPTQPAAAAADSCTGTTAAMAAPALAPAPAPAQLSNGHTSVTNFSNFSLFKDRLTSGARASTSTKHTHAPAHEKDTTQRHNQPPLPVPVPTSTVTPAPVASSSVCSVNDDTVQSIEPKHAGKRKIREADDSSSNTEEMDDDSAGEKRIPFGRGSSAKKSRAAEVHNFSERRRREKINEKMKALQELIPNCSKADKASMLDDAIEYLKTLQLHVQMMSMGNGMYMPAPMMIPPMMQPLRAPHMAHYPPMGMGLYQMGMYPQQFIQGPMHGMIAPMPVRPQMPMPDSVNMRPTIVVSSCENIATAGPDASVGSTFVRESTGAANPAKPDPKTEML